jgi:hypothetical protein
MVNSFLKTLLLAFYFYKEIKNFMQYRYLKKSMSRPYILYSADESHSTRFLETYMKMKAAYPAFRMNKDSIVESYLESQKITQFGENKVNYLVNMIRSMFNIKNITPDMEASLSDMMKNEFDLCRLQITDAEINRKKDWHNKKNIYEHAYSFLKIDMTVTYRPYIVDKVIQAFQVCSGLLYALLGFRTIYMPAGNYRQKFYYYKNKSSKTCLFFIHGVGIGPSKYIHFLYKLQSQYSIIVYEIYGSHIGDSLITENIDNKIAVIVDFVLQAKEERVVLIGHSFGSLVANAIYNNYKFYTDTHFVKKIILIDPVCFLHNNSHSTYLVISDYAHYSELYKNELFSKISVLNYMFYHWVVHNIRNQHLTKRLWTCLSFYALEYDIDTMFVLGDRDSIVKTSELLGFLHTFYPASTIVVNQNCAHGEFLVNWALLKNTCTKIADFINAK